MFFVDIFFYADMYMRSQIFRQSRNGKIYTSPVEIKKIYMDELFFLDAFAMLPWDVIAAAVYVFGGDVVLAFALTRFFKTAKALQLITYVQELFWFSHLGYIPITPSGLNVCIIITAFPIVAHVYACIWWRFVITATENGTKSWIEFDHFNTNTDPYDSASHHSQYIRSLYMTVQTLSSVGNGDVAPTTHAETMFQLLNVITGAILIALIVSIMAVWITDYEENPKIQQRHHIADVRKFLQRQKINRYDGKQIVSILQEKFARKSSTSTEEDLKILPMYLRMQLMEAVHMRWIQNIDVLKRFPQDDRVFKSHIISGLRTRQVISGEWIFKIYEQAKSIFFIANGTVSLEGEEEGDTNVIQSPKFFGHEIVSGITIRIYSARAVVNTDLLYLESSLLEDIQQRFATFNDSLLYKTLKERRLAVGTNLMSEVAPTRNKGERRVSVNMLNEKLEKLRRLSFGVSGLNKQDTSANSIDEFDKEVEKPKPVSEWKEAEEFNPTERKAEKMAEPDDITPRKKSHLKNERICAISPIDSPPHTIQK